MRKPIYTFAIICAVAFGFTACSGSDDAEEGEASTEQDMNASNDEDQQETEPEEEESPLGNFAGLVGDWSVDAATAGIQIDLTFGEDGSFAQKMGELTGEGTWEVVDEDHITIKTQNTSEDGQTWLMSNMTENSVDACWNPDAAKPKILPLKRVK